MYRFKDGVYIMCMQSNIAITSMLRTVFSMKNAILFRTKEIHIVILNAFQGIENKELEMNVFKAV